MAWNLIYVKDTCSAWLSWLWLLQKVVWNTSHCRLNSQVYINNYVIMHLKMLLQPHMDHMDCAVNGMFWKFNNVCKLHYDCLVKDLLFCGKSPLRQKLFSLFLMGYILLYTCKDIYPLHPKTQPTAHTNLVCTTGDIYLPCGPTFLHGSVTPAQCCPLPRGTCFQSLCIKDLKCQQVLEILK